MDQTTDRVAEAAALFATAGATGRVELAVLGDDDECVLGAGTWALSDAAVWRAWSAAGDDERAGRTAAAVESLVARGYVVGVDDLPDGRRLTLSAAAGLVQAARSRPFFVVTALPSPGDVPLLSPLGYGVVEEGHGLRGVVLELRDAGRHDYRLLSVRRAAEGLAAWAHRAVTTDAWGARADAVVLEVIRHREGEPLEAAAVTATASDSPQDGMTLFFGGRRERHDSGDLPALTDSIERLLRQSAEEAVPVGAAGSHRDG